jgi:hypothetical protein
VLKLSKKVLVSVPNTGNIHKLVSLATNKLLTDKRHKVTLIYPTHVPYENNLHKILVDFLKYDYDYWLNIDSDNPPIENPLDLVAYDLDVIGLPTPVWHYTGKVKGERPIYENAYKYVPKEDGYTEWSTKDGLQEVDAVGTGCLLMNKRVFEKDAMRRAPFQRIYNKDGTVERGNDIAFCEKARRHGYKIYAHYDYRCQHFAELELHEVMEAFHQIRK